MTNIYYPTIYTPYNFNPQEKIILRTACSAGVNRSATVRKIIKKNINPASIVYRQYGAHYGNYKNDRIVSISNGPRDGYYQLFGSDKCPSVQATIFLELGYVLPDNMGLQYLEEEHRKAYTEMILEKFWKFDPSLKNVFVLINEDDTVINNVIAQLNEINANIDLVIVKMTDTIYEPIDPNVKPQSKRAYEKFIELVKPYFSFD